MCPSRRSSGSEPAGFIFTVNLHISVVRHLILRRHPMWILWNGVYSILLLLFVHCSPLFPDLEMIFFFLCENWEFRTLVHFICRDKINPESIHSNTQVLTFLQVCLNCWHFYAFRGWWNILGCNYCGKLLQLSLWHSKQEKNILVRIN